MTDEHYNLLCDLRAIPQRLNHSMLLHGKQVAAARELVNQGLVVESNGLDRGEFSFRLNKPGRQALLVEWMRRGRPNPARTDGK